MNHYKYVLNQFLEMLKLKINNNKRFKIINLHMKILKLQVKILKMEYVANMIIKGRVLEVK